MSRLPRRFMAPVAGLGLILCCGAQAEPVTVRSCDRTLTVTRPPQRAVSYDSNLTEMMLALDLTDRMAGYIGHKERLRASALDLFPKAAQLRQIQRGYPNRETLLAEDVDFYFAGWSYGMRVGGEVTPEKLARLGIPVYELTESCVRIGRREKPTLDFLYRDLLNLGRIFGVAARAEALVAGYRRRIDAVSRRIAGQPRPVIFLFDSPGRMAGTAGAHSMPTALVEAAGGRNMADDIPGNWTRMSWERVIAHDPDAIIMMDFGPGDVQRKRDFLASRPGLRDLRAFRQGRILTLGYNELTPGPRNVTAVEKIAEFLHGDR
ncbi:ABC transporter substrate-binding protein [Camelimonas sp. ID_303_24]